MEELEDMSNEHRGRAATASTASNLASIGASAVLNAQCRESPSARKFDAIELVWGLKKQSMELAAGNGQAQFSLKQRRLSFYSTTPVVGS